MPADTYTSAPSTGRLKLKGVTDNRVDKKKKKKKAKPDIDTTDPKSNDIQKKPESGAESFTDTSVVLKHLPAKDEDEDEDGDEAPDQPAQTQTQSQPQRQPDTSESDTLNPKESDPNPDHPPDLSHHLKTPSELRFEEQRRKRLEERLKREGVKSHKQRVEELNRYLSGLSEHHDMPKIGPG